MNKATEALYDKHDALRPSCPIADVCPGICDRCPDGPVEKKLTSSRIQCWSKGLMMGLIPLVRAQQLVNAGDYVITNEQAITYIEKENDENA